MADQQKLNREEIAKIEIGHTAIGRRVAWVLVIIFIFTIFSVPIVQHVYEFAQHRWGGRESAVPQCYDILASVPKALDATRGDDLALVDRVMAADRVLLRDMKEYEDQLKDESLLAKTMLPPAQSLLTPLGLGNEKAYCGRDGWLFYRPGIDYLIGPPFLGSKQLARRAATGTEWKPAPQPDPRKAVAQFKKQLASRGIKLIVMPTPTKIMIHPEKFSRACDNQKVALQNPSYPEFTRELERQGVLVFDVAQAVMDAKWLTGQPQYLETDTHWRPETMELVAQQLKDFITTHVNLPPVKAPGYKRETQQVINLGDIATMLKLPDDQTIFRKQTATIQQVLTTRNQLWQASGSAGEGLADVLLLGDSFSNVYSLESMGWGESAGLVEQLSFLMQRPVDRMVRNDDGAFATRQMLSRELARGRDRLAGKKVVIWQFAARELAVGDWKLIDMILGVKPPSLFIAPEPGKPMTVSGTIQALSAPPKPGTVAYKDHIIAFHLTDLENEKGPMQGAQAMVYVWSMRNNKWTPAARYRPGAKLKLRLRAWAEVSEKYDAINRAELDDAALQLEEPCWGEEIK